MFGIAWCCQPHRMGQEHYPNLEMDMGRYEQSKETCKLVGASVQLHIVRANIVTDDLAGTTMGICHLRTMVVAVAMVVCCGNCATEHGRGQCPASTKLAIFVVHMAILKVKLMLSKIKLLYMMCSLLGGISSTINRKMWMTLIQLFIR